MPLSWFHEITRNRYVDVALLVDNTGHLASSSRRVGSAANRIAPMINAAEEIAHGLATALDLGAMRMLQLSTQSGHLLVLPVGATYYLIVLMGRGAPLELLISYIQRLIGRLSEEEIILALKSGASPLDDLDVNELIDAVSEWLHSGGDSDDTHVP